MKNFKSDLSKIAADFYLQSENIKRIINNATNYDEGLHAILREYNNKYLPIHPSNYCGDVIKTVPYHI